MMTTNEIDYLQDRVNSLERIRNEIIDKFDKLLVEERYIDFYYLYNGVKYPDSINFIDDICCLIDANNIDFHGAIVGSDFVELIFLDKGVNYALIEEHCHNEDSLLFFLENKYLSEIVNKDKRILELLYSRFKHTFKLLKYLIKNGRSNILDTTDSFTKSVIEELGE